MSRPSFSRKNTTDHIEVVEVHENVNQEVIKITEDKLRLITKDYVDSISKAGGWLTPASLLVSFILTFCTAEFEEFLQLKPDFWRALFFILSILAVVWLIWEIKKGVRCLSLDDFINKVKNKKEAADEIMKE